MFDYVANRYNPDPRYVLAGTPPPSDRLIRDLPFSTTSVLPLPGDAEGLRALHGSKFWSTLRRKERRFVDAHGPLTFRVLTEEAALREALPQVQQLYAERWASEYTSLPWKTPEGFAPYAEAMVALAAEGRAELAVLESEKELLSYAYSLRQDGTYHFFQHAAVTASEYRRYSPGRLLVWKLVTHVVERGDCHTFDFMVGDADYKREWSHHTLPVFLRVTGERTPVGRVRFAAKVAASRLRVFVQFNPRLRAAAKRVLLASQRRSGT